MSVLKRRLFNRGGQVVSSRGVGITSGLTTPKRGYVNGPGSYAGEGIENMPTTQQDFFQKNREMLQSFYPERKTESRLSAASPALLALSSALLSGKSYQGGVGGALDILGQGLEKSTPFFNEVVNNRRKEDNAVREESINMDLQALNMAREDQAEYEKKIKPFSVEDNTYLYNPEKDSYEIVASKPGKLVTAVNVATGNKEFVPENIIRAEAEAFAANPDYTKKYIAEKIDDDLTVAFNNETKKWGWIPKANLQDLTEGGENLYSPKTEENTLTVAYSVDEKKNVLITQSDLNKAVDSNNKKYEPKKEGLDIYQEVYSKTLGANVFVSKLDIANDASLNLSDREYQGKKNATSFVEYYDPIFQKNVLTTNEEVLERLNDNNLLNDYEPKKPETNTLKTVWSLAANKNVLATTKNIIENPSAYEPEHKNDATKAAIDSDTGEVVYVTNKQIIDGGGRYRPAIMGESITVDKDGNITIKKGLSDSKSEDLSNKAKEKFPALDGLVLMSEELVGRLKEADSTSFGFIGAIKDFNNKYLTQIGTPYAQDTAEIRRDVREMGESVLRFISDDQRFTDKDREYIGRITGVDAIDSFQSYEEVLMQVNQLNLLLEEKVVESAGQNRKIASHQMDIEQLHHSYLNFLLDTNKELPAAHADYIRDESLPSFNAAQFNRRVAVYFPQLMVKK